MNETLLEVKDLKVSFTTYAGQVQAVRGVNFSLAKGEILAVVGESGCGKSVTAKSIIGLNPTPPSHVDGGQILLNGQDLVTLKEKEMRKLRGKNIGMIFQDPMTSLDPTKQIGYQIMEAIVRHEKVSRKEAYARSVKMLELVGINNPTQRMKQYPHEFSGGMRQRAMIAMSLVCNPQLLIADEPTTALDVTIQAQILELMQSLQKKLGMAIIMVTHDLGVIAEMCDEIVVMYGGRFCERGTADEIFYNPRHEYTRGLLRSIPNITNMKERLVPISGTPINMLNMPKGCAFCARCDKAMKICLEQVPEERIINESHRASCWINTRDNIGTVEEAE